MLENQLSEAVDAALFRLSPSERTVLLLRTLEDKPYIEIASVMGKSISAVRKQYERAKNKLKKYILYDEGVTINETVSIL